MPQGTKTRRAGSLPGEGRHGRHISAAQKRAELLEKARAAVGDAEWHPVVELAKMGMAVAPYSGAKVKGDYYLRMSALKEVAQYVAPKMKAIEVEAAGDTAKELSKLAAAVAQYRS